VRRYSYWPLVFFVCVCVFCLCWHFRCEWWWWSRFHRQRRIVAAHTHTCTAAKLRADKVSWRQQRPCGSRRFLGSWCRLFYSRKYY
jgi:hypothetical protein